jgi:hypothetical protein
MKTMNLIFAIACGALTLAAIAGVFFYNAHHHIATAFCCGFLTMLFAANSGNDKKKGLSVK